MCGITGYIGNKKALPIVLNTLKTLEYRGYDSSGVAYIKNNKSNIIKEQGKISCLEKLLNLEENATAAIAHTRWATHGVPNKTNAHPHKVGKITLVHNGIIENFNELKNELLERGYKFKTQTDTEVACAYIDYLFKKHNDMLFCLNKATEVFKGSFALAILVDNDKKIYFIRNNSPLVIGVGNNENYLASDVPAFLSYTNKYVLIDNEEYGFITKDEIIVLHKNSKVKKEVLTFTGSINAAMKNGYEHFMLKEINEQSELIKNLAASYLTDEKTLLNKIPDITKYNKIYIVGCGSAYHAGLIGKYLIENNLNIEVFTSVASEFRYNKLFIDKKTLVILISQSGETADTLASLRIAKEKNAHTLAIVNTVGSSIAREADTVLYIHAGIEIAVATTKAYSLQIVMLSLITIASMIRKKIIKYTSNLLNMYKKASMCIENECKSNMLKIAKKISKKDNIFFIGRGIDYALSMESSLKLKEISYVHSEAYAAGELKHGTISLIEKGTPIIAIITQKYLKEKTISNMKEVEARGAHVILVITSSLDNNENISQDKIVIEDINNLVNPILTIVPLQILAYYIAKIRKCDIDKPRNLAKSVTVE